jgi:hypothetical protein
VQLVDDVQNWRRAERRGQRVAELLKLNCEMSALVSGDV